MKIDFEIKVVRTRVALRRPTYWRATLSRALRISFTSEAGIPASTAGPLAFDPDGKRQSVLIPCCINRNRSASVTTF